MDNPLISYNDELHRYVRISDNVVIPSVTQVLSKVGISDVSQVPPDLLEKARKFGSAVHAFCEITDKNEEYKYDAPASELFPCIMAWEQFKKDFNVQIIDIEKMVYNEEYNYCGRLDRRALVNGKRTVIDIKTSTSYYPSTGVQLVAYMDDKDEDVMAVHLGQDGTYKVYGTQKYGKQKKVHIDIEECRKDWIMAITLYNKYAKKER